MNDAIIAQGTNGSLTVYVFHRECWRTMISRPGMSDHVDRNLYILAHTAHDPIGKCSHTDCSK